MSKIRDLFSTSRRIDRRIEKVIDYAALSDERLLAEIGEYEATDNVEACARKFLENYQIGVQGGQVTEIGVWMSGFYGSGKSSFTKYLGLALDPDRIVGGRPFLDLLTERFQSAEVRGLLRSVAKKIPTAVVFLDLGAEQLAENAAAPVSAVLYWKVLHWLGYSKDKKLASLELLLERQGKLDTFQQLYRERWGEDWETIHNDPLLGTARGAQVVPVVLPQDFSTPESFSELEFDLAQNLNDLAQEMIDLVRHKTGRQNILFLIDEAGQYVATRGELILNLDGFVRAFKELGQGKVWMVATGQQTLAEIVTKAQYNSAELNKLQARFPLTIELDARDIKEITYRRLLTKTGEGETQLKDLFRANGQALITHTRLTGTALYRTDPDTDTFAQYYPFLPHHFDLLLDLIRSLARSTGGIGLRSAIKVIQDVLVDVNRLLPPDAVKLADRPVGSLACADDIYDILRADILKVLPHVVTAVDQATQIFGAKSPPVRVAKAVAALQNIESVPCTAENIAALLYSAVGNPGLLTDVREALKALLAAKEIGLIEDPKVGGYVFLSTTVRPLQQERNEMPVASGDLTRIRHEILKKVFDPQPSARLENTKEVKAAVRSGKFLIVGDAEDMTIRLEWVDDPQWETRRMALLTETTAQAEWQNAIAWLARTSDTAEELLPEIYRSEQIAQHIDERNADRDAAQFLRAELKQAERYRDEVERLLRQALMGGTLIFRGRPTPAAEAGVTIDAAARALLGRAAQEVFLHYHLAPIRASTDLADKFLSVDRMDRLSDDRDPLHLVTKRGGMTQVDVSHPALAETLRAFQTKLDETGGGRLLGNFIQDFFAAPPYGWSKDTVRYLFAALLAAGKVEFHTAEGLLKVPGPKAAEASKSTVAFNKVGVSLRDAPPDPEALERAARRLEELFGDTEVLPLEDNIGRAVRRHLPGLLDMVGALPDRLRLLALPGEARAISLKANLLSVLSGDATDAGAILGARASSLPEDIRWARAVLKAFDEDAESTVRAATCLRNAIAEVDMFFPGEGKYLLSDSEKETLTDALGSERFFERLADVRAVTHVVTDRAQARYTKLRREVETEQKAIAAHVEANPNWPLLLDEDRTAIMQELQSTLPPISAGADPIDGLKTLLVRRNGLAGLQRDLEAEIERRKPPAISPPPVRESLLDEAARRVFEKETELAQAQKLKHLGTMAGAMAHGLNQPIGIIRAIADGSLSDIRSGLVEMEEVPPRFESILAQTDRLARIVENMRAFARGDTRKREPVDLRLVVRQMCEMFADQFANRHIHLQCSASHPETALLVLANPVQVQEVLINLLTNARDAVEGRPDPRVEVTAWCATDGRCAFSVEDNGPGLPAEYREKLFTPFVTTKSSEQGTGLGLFTSWRVVTDLGGQLLYEDRPGGGARFIVHLPPLKES